MRLGSPSINRTASVNSPGFWFSLFPVSLMAAISLVIFPIGSVAGVPDAALSSLRRLSIAPAHGVVPASPTRSLICFWTSSAFLIASTAHCRAVARLSASKLLLSFCSARETRPLASS